MALSKVDLANQVENQLPQSLVADNVNFRNIIINGDMSIAQRGTSQSSVTTTGYYTCDRWNWIADYGTVTLSQDTDVPTGQGFATSFKADVTTAGTEASGGYVLVRQRIEGQNLQYLKKGTASAESLTASFWIKSTKTGTYICELFDVDNNRQISKSYTVDTTNTWEKKTITFAGDTTGAFGNDNGGSLFLNLYLSAGTDYTSGTLNTSWAASVNVNRVVGQVNAQDNASNNIYFTGVQLEAGTSASDFEFLPYDVNLQRCQRYFVQYGENIDGAAAANIGIGQWYSASEVVYNVYAPVSMRTKPTMTTPTVVNKYRFHKAGTYTDTDDAGAISDAGNQILAIYKSGLSGGTGGQATFVVLQQGGGAKIQFSSEL